LTSLNNSANEAQRRRALVEARQVDFARWRDLDNFPPEWDDRAHVAASWVDPDSAVLDLGCGRMSLETLLPTGCRYVPADLFARDARTKVCNVETDALPSITGLHFVVALGLIEYLNEPSRLYRKVRALGARFINSYHPLVPQPPINRSEMGWMNALTMSEWLQLAKDAGFQVEKLHALSATQYLGLFAPE
jgi:hypothetical protein